MRLTRAIEEFIAITRATHAKATADAYESDLKRLAALASHDTVLNFTGDLVRTYLTALSEQGLKMSSLHRKMSCLNQFATWGIGERLWHENPVGRLPKVRRPKTLPRPFRRQEVEALWALELPPTEHLLRAVLFFTGLRVTPICGIRVANISTNPPLIETISKGSRPHLTPLHPVLLGIVTEYLAQRPEIKRHDLLFTRARGRPFTKKSVERVTHAWGERAGVPQCVPHRFRHSFATTLLESCGDLRVVQEALGHADIKSTTIYTEVTDRRLREAVASLPWGRP